MADDWDAWLTVAVLSLIAIVLAHEEYLLIYVASTSLQVARGCLVWACYAYVAYLLTGALNLWLPLAKREGLLLVAIACLLSALYGMQNLASPIDILFLASSPVTGIVLHLRGQGTTTAVIVRIEDCPEVCEACNNLFCERNPLSEAYKEGRTQKSMTHREGSREP